mmetsp:Transcript_3100/g.5716  ORF Transcript_3100/g.5716 Transcript_3100/m.5716 type:complete len:202 (+) Transcript_3100:147-752(+)
MVASGTRIGCCRFGGITSRQQERLYGPYRTCVRHGPEYQEALTRILDLVSLYSSSALKSKDKPELPCQEDIIFSCRRQQAFLVTQVGTANNTMTTTTTHPEKAPDVFEWPRDHSSFIESDNSGLLLNIAAAPCPPFQQVVGKETFLVSPGSFCAHTLLYIILKDFYSTTTILNHVVKQQGYDKTTTTTSPLDTVVQQYAFI